MTIQKRQRPTYGAYFFAACEVLFREPLFCHRDASGGIRLLIWSDDAAALREGLVVAASCGCMPDVRVEIALCGATARALQAVLRSEAPMFDEIFSRKDTADIRFDASPADFPPYVLCTEDKRPFVPAGVHCAVLRPSEISGELLRLAENLHYTFMVSYGSRDSLADILSTMHRDNYNYASSVLQAAHLPVKLWCADAHGRDIEEAAMRYAERIAADRGLMNRLVSLEHTRWSVFMALSGWRIPTVPEMESYAFVEQADGSMIASFRHEEGLLHPALAACSPEGVDALEGAGGEEYWNGADASQLDPLSRMSLWQHRRISGIAEVQRSRARALLEEARTRSVGEVPELNRLVGVLNRLPSSAMELEKALVQMEGRIDGALLRRLRTLLRSSIEAANDYVCSVRYRKTQKNGVEGLTPLMKLVWDEFEMPEEMSEALEAFHSCFERCENGRWRFASATAKGLFAAEGNLLEDYVWYQVHRNPCYRDVQLSFQFGLASGNDKLEQEIDVIAITTRNRPVLFSCKLGAKGLEADSGKEIASHSRIYAVNNPIPVLVTSCPEAIAAQKGFGPDGSERRYLERRGVCFVDRAILGDEQRFQQLLNEIASR